MLSWLFRNRIFLFLWATITGCLFALVWKQYEQTIHQTLTFYRITPSNFDYQWAYKLLLNTEGLHSLPILRKNDSESKSKTITEDKWLSEKVPVYCIIMAKKVKQTKAVKNTWTKHCNKALFYGNFNDNAIPVNKIGSKGSWEFLCEILISVWNGYHDDFKWVLVVDDKTYAIVENLRYMVAGLDFNESYYLGHTFRDYDGQFNVEDAGFALSWATLEALHNKFPNVEACSRADYWHGGDRTLGKVLEEIGVKPRDTRDILERSRFLPFNLEKLLIPGAISVFSRYWRESVFLSPEGSNCCSDFVVTFSDITPDKMYMMEYIIYHLKPVSSTWPRIDDIGPPLKSNLPTASPANPEKPKAIGKATVSELTAKKKSKTTNDASAKTKNLKTRAVLTSKSITKQDKGTKSFASLNLDRIKANDRPQIKNGHMNHADSNGIEIGVYDDTFQDAEEGNMKNDGSVYEADEISANKHINNDMKSKENDDDADIFLNTI